MTEAAWWIAHLQLTPHPEGGYFRRVYTAAHWLEPACLPATYDGPRPLATAIYYLLPGDQVSRLHRLRADELWHFYHGSPLTVHQFDKRCGYQRLHLGQDATAEQTFMAMLPAGSWFGATVDQADGFSLIGCTVAPGFDFADFELADGADLSRDYPAQAALIERLRGFPEIIKPV